MLRYEASAGYETDASCLSMTVYSGLLQQKVFSLPSGLANIKPCSEQTDFTTTPK